MIFIEIGDTIINVEEISHIRRNVSKYDPNIYFDTTIEMANGDKIPCNYICYLKIKDIVKPIKLDLDDKA